MVDFSEKLLFSLSSLCLIPTEMHLHKLRSLLNRHYKQQLLYLRNLWHKCKCKGPASITKFLFIYLVLFIYRVLFYVQTIHFAHLLKTLMDQSLSDFGSRPLIWSRHHAVKPVFFPLSSSSSSSSPPPLPHNLLPPSGAGL